MPEMYSPFLQEQHYVAVVAGLHFSAFQETLADIFIFSIACEGYARNTPNLASSPSPTIL